MVLGGAGRHDQPAGDLPVRAAPREQAQHLDLAVGQPRRPVPTDAPGPVTGRGQHGAHGLVVQTALPRLLGESVGCGVHGVGGAMGPIMGQPVEDVGGGQDPRRHRQVGPRTGPAVVAGAVAALVVQPRQCGDRGQRRGAAQDPLAVVRVQMHLFALAVGERPRLVPHPAGHADPADVVQQPCQPQRTRPRLVEVQPLTSGLRELGDGGRVAVQVRALEVHHLPERPRHLRQPGARDHPDGARLRREDRGGCVGLGGSGEQVGAHPGEHVDEPGIQGAARAPTEGLQRRLDAAEAVEQDGDGRDLGDPGGHRDGVAARAPWGALAVPPLE